MAALDFPNAPINGTQYTAPNGAVYTFDGAAWTVSGVLSTGTAAGGDLQGTYPNPTIKPASLPWSVSGATLTPTDATKRVVIPGPTASGADQSNVVLGTRTIKGHLIAMPGADTFVFCVNIYYNGTAWVQEDTTKPSWFLNMDLAANSFAVQQAPAAGVLSARLVLDASGNLTCYGNAFSTGNDTSAATTPGVRVNGTTAGVRFKNVGTAGADGYSNSIAFGWSGSLQARVDATALGSVNITPPSDARLKLDVQDDVPGLAAVSALRPISFAYDQTKQEIGFPSGRHYGLIAQEAAPHVPLAIDDDGTPDHVLSIDYRELVPVLLQAVKELAAEVAALTLLTSRDA